MSQSLYPTLRYRDASAAIEWLERAFGFERREVHLTPDGAVAHAELALGDGVVMLGSERGGNADWRQPPGGAGIYVAMDEVDDHYLRAKEAGAEILMEPTDQDYGSRDYVCRDPEGNHWGFGTYRPGADAAD